jgi:hypothetical protein
MQESFSDRNKNLAIALEVGNLARSVIFFEESTKVEQAHTHFSCIGLFNSPSQVS